MRSLNIEIFMQVNEDMEKRKYQVLDAIRSAYDDFSHNRIYPTLSLLIDLYRNLDQILQRFSLFRQDMPKTISGLDLGKKEILFTTAIPKEQDLSQVEDLINWALPHIRKSIEEGTSIYEFVDENIELEQVGFIPSYIDEGYFFVPDPASHVLKVYKYELSVFTGSKERFKALKTSFLKDIDTKIIQPSPSTVKLELVGQIRELPNPATFSFYTQLDFPFMETLFPVAKRKLMEQLHAA